MNARHIERWVSLAIGMGSAASVSVGVQRSQQRMAVPFAAGVSLDGEKNGEQAAQANNNDGGGGGETVR